MKNKHQHQNAPKSRLHELYVTQLRPQLKESLQLGNIMEVPKVTKVVINVGAKEAVADSRALQVIEQGIVAIAGQASVRTKARKSIAGFKIREGMALGVMVTLRQRKMYEFLDKLINLALPKVRDFQGVSIRFDGRGNYNLGIKEWSIFPESDLIPGDKLYGMNITIQTTAKNDQHAFELLKSFGMPFRKK
jgi:large subunit ribosomal protein L5